VTGKIVLYTRPTCLFCEQVRDLFRDGGIPFREVVVSDVVQQMELMEKCDARSFPVVFVDDIYIGGFTHIVHLHSQGRLKELLGGELELELPAPTELRGSEYPRSPVSDAVNMIQGFAAWGEYKSRRG
jgi:glutaredoxin 3